jgi:hypothetical protein
MVAVSIGWQWFAAGRILPPTPEPTPIVIPDDATATDSAAIARRAVLDFTAKSAAMFDAAAADLKAGKITEAAQLSEALKAGKSVKESLWNPVYSDWNDRFGGDKWDAAKAAETLSKTAAGVRGIK